VCKHLLTKISLALLLLTLSCPALNAAGLDQALLDPTRPPGSKVFSSNKHKTLAQRWILSSTLIANNRRHAVINGQIVAIGQRVERAKVISIQPNAVWLILKQKRFRIKMLANKIKDFSSSADK